MSAEESLTNKQLLDTLMQAIKDVKEEGKLNNEELKKEIKSETQIVVNKLDENSNKIKLLNQRISYLENKCIVADRLRRKNNILIFGLEVPESVVLLDFTLNKLYELLGIQLQESDINNIFQINGAKSPGIKVEFVTFLKKDLVFKNSNKLKGTRIFIAQDLGPEDRRDYKILAENLKKAKTKNCSARIKGKTLEIDGEIYTVQQLQELEKENSEISEDFLLPTAGNITNNVPTTSSLSNAHAGGSGCFVQDVNNTELAKQSNRREKQEDTEEFIVRSVNLSSAVKKKEEEKKTTHGASSTVCAKNEKPDRQLRNQKNR